MTVNPARLVVPAPSKPSKSAGPGLHPLGLGGDRDGLLYVPDTAGALPLLLVLHGATMQARQMARPLLAAADDHGVVLLVPDSRRETWDVLLGNFGPDVEFVNSALAAALDRCEIDTTRLGLAGVSDGASYALSLGLANGDTFASVIALSPGFVAPPALVGKPRVFLTHGIRDPILPIDTCGRPIAAGLHNSGYEIDYREFDGGHEMPEPLVRAAFGWFVEA